jgi:hypothetical protein
MRLNDVSFHGNQQAVRLPPQSITLFIFPLAPSPPQVPRSAAVNVAPAVNHGLQRTLIRYADPE